jgi:hypothetical protein
MAEMRIVEDEEAIQALLQLETARPRRMEQDSNEELK